MVKNPPANIGDMGSISGPWIPHTAEQLSPCTTTSEPVLWNPVCLCLITRHVRLFATPWTAAGQVLCSWGFSRQEHWSGLPCPPPGDLPNPGIKPRSSTLQVDSLPSKAPGKLKNTGVGSLSLFQIFLTQELNWGLLHCRWIHYLLSHQGNP